MSEKTIPRSRGRATAAALAGALLALVGGMIVAPAAGAAPSTGTSFHVDCSRAVSGDGSAVHPWNSVKPVNAHVAFQPGDRILLKRGSTCTGRIRPLGSGSPGSPIVLGAYGPDKALPTVAAGGSADDTGAVGLFNQSYWTVQDLHLTNRGAPAETNKYRYGLMIMNKAGGRLPGITVQRLEVDSVVSNLTFARADAREFGGIAVITWPAPHKNDGYDGLRVLGNRVTEVGRTGIVVSNHGYPKTFDRDVRISGNRIIRARGDSIVLRGSVDGRIDHNVSAHGADFWPCKQCGSVSPETANAGIWPAATRNVVVEYNEVYGEHRLGGDGEAFDIDISAENTVVQYNYAHDNEGGGILFCGSKNTTARFNILEDNQLGAFTFIGSIPASNTKIYNNTVYSKPGNDAKVVRTFGGIRGKNVSFFNNLIYNMSDKGYYTWPTKPKSRTNIFVGVHGIDEPRGYAEEFADPGLFAPGTGRTGFGTLEGYRRLTPKDDTPGTAIPKSVTKDFFGKKINPKKPPRGAAG